MKAGSVSHVPVAGYDFLPTFFDLAGGTGSLGDEIDGVSFGAVLKDADTKSVNRQIDALVFHRPGREVVTYPLDFDLDQVTSAGHDVIQLGPLRSTSDDSMETPP